LSNKKPILIMVAVAILIVYIVFLPSPTAEIAVRKDIFFSMHPVLAFTAAVHNQRSTAAEGHLYTVNELELSFIYVQKNALGWRVTSNGTGP
jgi:hypothetical protein